MQGIDALGFAWGNAEEERVKLIHPLDQGRGPCIHFARCRALRGIKVVNIPAGEGNLLHEIDARGQQFPKRFGRISTGETASHTDDRNRLGHRRLVPLFN